MQQAAGVDARVWTAVAELLARPDVVGYALAQREAEASGSARDWEKDLKGYERKLRRVEEADAQILERFRRGKIGESAMDIHLDASAREREMLDMQVRTARQQSQLGRVSEQAVAEVRVMIGNLQSRLADVSQETKRDLVRALVPGRCSGRARARGLAPDVNDVIVLGARDLSIGVILGAHPVVSAVAAG
jgi:hypothetical protein